MKRIVGNYEVISYKAGIVSGIKFWNKETKRYDKYAMFFSNLKGTKQFINGLTIEEINKMESVPMGERTLSDI